MGTNKIQLNQIITALRKKQDLEGELSQDKKEMLQKTMKNMLIIDKELAEQKKEFEDLQSVVSEDSNARIKVYGTAYAGTKLVFGDQFMFIKEKYDHCQFIKERADIQERFIIKAEWERKMIVRPVDFAVVQQMNEVSHIKQEENQRPVVEQQTITTQVQKETDTKAEQVQHKENADNHQKKYDAKDKSQNEYPDGHHQGKKGSKDGKFFIKGQEIVDIDIKI